MIKYKIFFIFLLITVSIYSQYVPDWVQIQNQTNLNVDNPELSVMDGSGNIYIANTFYNSGNNDIVLTKFSDMGIILWQKIYDSNLPENNDTPRKIIIDQTGNIIICGNSSDGNFTSNKIIILKYTSAGTLLSSVQYKRAGSNVSAVSDISSDNNGNYFIAGLVHDDQVYIDSVLNVKFNSGLNVVWSKTYRDSVSYLNKAGNVNTDPAGNVYFSGISDFNILAFKYDNSGNLLWLKKYPCITSFLNTNKLPVAIMDSGQNLYISSSKMVISGNDTSRVLLVKYNSAGNLQWTGEYNLADYGSDIPSRIFLLNSDIYLFTNSYDSSYILKTNSSGQLQWQNTLQNKVFFADIDNTGKILTSGYKNAYFRQDLCLQKFSNDGSALSTYTYSFNGSGSDLATKFYNTNDNKLLTLGYHNSSVMLIKLTASNTHTFSLSRNNINKPITDSNYTYDTINITPLDLPAYSQVKNVYINIDTIQHTSVGDLIISLVHENKTDTLIYQRGGTLDNIIGAKLSDTAAALICGSGIPPFTGFFKPCFPLTQFKNLTAAGPWIFKIYDRRAPETGILKAWSLTVEYESAIGIQNISGEIPSQYLLQQNYPNPFNPETKIRFSLPLGSAVKLTVYDLNGKEIETIADGYYNAGFYEAEFNGSKLASGVYFYKLKTKDFTETKKMVLIK